MADKTKQTASLRYRYPRRVAALAVLVGLAAACGQKPGVYDPALPQAIGSLGPPQLTYAVDPETGEIVIFGGPRSANSEGSVAGAASHGEAPSTRERGPLGSDPASPILSAPTPPSGGDATGITSDTIKIGFHLPVTGAAPVPPFAPESFKRYFNYRESEGQFIAGRRVEIVWMNDAFDASTARSVCKEMVEGEKVFMLVGYAGPHTIRACARYAAGQGVPYVAPGSIEHYMADLDTQFALTMTYARQNPILADLLVDRFSARTRKNALVRMQASEPPEKYVTTTEALEARGARFEVDHQMETQANSTEIQTIVTDLKQKGIDNVLFAGGPTHFTYFSQAAGRQGFHPRILGPGPTAAFDTFLGGACADGRVAHNALMLHITPGFVDRRRYDPEFDRALGSTNEIDWMFWGLAKPIAELLELPGRELTRERFLWYTARAKDVATGVFPPFSFSPEDHFGGESIHLLRADCDDIMWHTEKAFLKG